ncbi:MAG TPA: leucine-rich repeat domain-containing protein [Phnomibacter sp.]|nr:leucine-rich repeat domain-containing protein [Phnomibacter sp.]
MIDQQWWQGLEQQWKDAFAAACFGHTNEPTADELAVLFQAPALRFAGPSAPYPNMNFELSNLSGLAELKNLQILVVVHQQIETIEELSALTNLNSLFLYHNKISDLSPIAELVGLQMLYVQGNQITSLLPVQKLTKLKELYVNQNNISSLEGLTEAHADTLEMFFCKPNEQLKNKELLQVERELGIRCRTA